MPNHSDDLAQRITRIENENFLWRGVAILVGLLIFCVAAATNREAKSLTLRSDDGSYVAEFTYRGFSFLKDGRQFASLTIAEDETGTDGTFKLTWIDPNGKIANVTIGGGSVSVGDGDSSASLQAGRIWIGGLSDHVELTRSSLFFFSPSPRKELRLGIREAEYPYVDLVMDGKQVVSLSSLFEGPNRTPVKAGALYLGDYREGGHSLRVSAREGVK